MVEGWRDALGVVAVCPGLLASLIDCHGTGSAAAAMYKSQGRAMDSEPTLRFVTGSGEALPLRGGAMGAGSVVLRPQNIAISAAAGPDTIAGRVLHSEFLGSQIRYIVRAAGAELVVDKSHHSSETAVPTGSDVALRVNMDSAVLLSA